MRLEERYLLKRHCFWLMCGALTCSGIAAADYQAVYLNDKPEIRHEVRKIDNLILERRWDEAIQKIQKMLVTNPEVVYQSGKNHYRGVRSQALRMLAQVPKECRDAYVARYEPRASRLAQLGADEALLKQIVSRYLFTPTADKVVHRLGALAVERGEMRQGAYWLEQLLLKYSADSIEAQIVAMLGFCYRHGGMLEPLRQLTAKSALRNDSLRIGSSRQMLAGYLRGLLAEAEADSKRLRNLESWPVPGGNWSQSRISAFEVKTSSTRWSRRYPVDISEFNYPWRSKPRYRGQLPVRHHPAVGGGAVYVSNGHMVYAMSYFSGRDLWRAGPLSRAIQTPQGMLQPYAVTYQAGSVYANLEVPTEGQAQTWLRYLIRTPLPLRVLVRIDSATGKVLWKTERPRLGRDAFINRVSILSPPVIRGNVAYTAGAFHEGYFKYYLMAFDTRNGDLKWKRRIGGGQQALNLFGRPFRELIGCMPALFGGRIYLCSNLGFVSCLDAESGEILWVSRYNRLPISTTQTHQLPPVDVTWYSRPPLVTQGLVLVTPVDSRFLYAYDANTGKLKWAVAAEGDHVLLGVTRGKVYTAGRRLRAFHVKTGKLALMPRPLGSGEGSVVGMGALTDKVGYVCTRYTQYRFSTEDLRILARTRPSVLGNLMLVGNVRIVTGQGRMAAYYDWHEIQRNLSGMINREPNEPFGYNGLASIYAQRDQFGLALEHYRKALVRARNNTSREYREAARRARSGIYSLYLAGAKQNRAKNKIAEALRDLDQAAEFAVGLSARLWVLQLRLAIMVDRGDHEAAADLVDKIEEGHGRSLIRIGSHRTTAGLAALLELAKLYVGQNQGHQAVTVYMRIISRHPEDEYDRIAGRTIGYTAIEALKKAYDPSIYHKWNVEAIRRLKLARRSGSIRELEAILSLYPNCTILPEVTMLMARRLIDTGRPLEAKSILQDFLRKVRQDSPHLPVARYLLFRALDKNKMYASAKGILLEMADQYGGLEIEVGDQQRLDLGDYARRRLDEKLYSSLEARPPQSALILGSGKKPAWTVRFKDAADARLVEPEGACPPQFRDRFFIDNKGQRGLLTCYRASDGALLWTAQAGVRLMGLAWSHGKLIAWLREGLVVGYDPSSGRPLWRFRVPGEIGSARVGRGLVAVVAFGTDGNPRGSLMLLLDAATGKLAWTSKFPAAAVSAPLIATRQLIAWSVRRPGQVFLFDLATGKWSLPFKLGREGLISAPVLFGRDRLAVPLSTKKLLIYDLRTGKNVEVVGVPDGIVDRGLMAGPRRIVISTGGRELEAYTPAGRRLWRLKLDRQAVLRRTIVHDHCFLVTQGSTEVRERSKEAVMVDMRTGAILWQSYLGVAGMPVWQMAVSQSHLVVQLGPRKAMRLVVIDRKSGKRICSWELKSSKMAYLVLAGGRLLVSLSDRVIAFGGPVRKRVK